MNVHYIIYLYILLAFSCGISSGQIAEFPPQDTLCSAIEWSFFHDDTHRWYPAQVPGVIHTDLLANGLIDDPFWRNNEKKLQWIGEKNWSYKGEFIITPYQIKQEHIEIIFDGLDTYADIKINGHRLMKTDNMFVQWKKDIKNLVRQGKNVVEIVFTSPILYNGEKCKNLGYTLPSGNESVPPMVGSFTRKAAYHFGWDWGPRFLTCGIWRPVKINAWSGPKIGNVYIHTLSIDADSAVISVEVEVEHGDSTDVSLVIDEKKIVLGRFFDKKSIHREFVIQNPILWWANGMGDPHLYTMNFTLTSANRIIDTKKIKYGIRTISLVNQKDSIGTSYYFVLNGKPVFIKGANYIPQDIFLPRVKIENYKRLLKDVKDAHMNMLRVWGGGIYENDIFYDLCDELGIMVWQDFMFAGSMYPVDSAFAKNVSREITYNIKRLRNHPSIAQWCGNNEIEVAWHNWGWQKKYGYTKDQEKKIWDGYQWIFHRMIPALCDRLDPSRPYVPTSPLSNWGKKENFNHGSMHYWGVWHGKDNFEDFKSNVGRFMVEYGFQSFPEMKTIMTFATNYDLSLDSEVMKNRQKSYIGNGMIALHTEKYFGKPKNFKDFVEKSQLTQAKAMEMAIKAHINSAPHCMGTMFWQLNDCWPGPSWSVIDYYGRHKKAYDTVKKAYR